MSKDTFPCIVSRVRNRKRLFYFIYPNDARGNIIDEIFTIIEALANHPISYDDQIVRQILESVIVESKHDFIRA